MPEQHADAPIDSPEAIGLSPRALERFGAVIEREIAAGRAPGATLAIIRHGKIGLAQAFGVLRPGGPPMPLDALFRVYSMTKPIVSVAAMTLVEEGRLFLTDPVSNFIPAFAETKVGIPDHEGLRLVAPRRPILVHDLLRHTSGLCYGFTGGSAVQRVIQSQRLIDASLESAAAIEAIAAAPLMHEPGSAWEYGLSTDVLGRVVETIVGASLGELLRERIFETLGMRDTAFFTPPEKLERRAEPHDFGALDAAGIDRMSQEAPPKFEMGGTGLIATLPDYVRFCAMLAGGGAVDGARILGPRTLALMASNHISPEMAIQDTPLMPPGHGFGLGFAVRVAEGLAPTAGAVGDYFWGGVAGTAFVVSPAQDMFAVMMVQAPEYREHFRNLFRNLLGAALL
jgi:CubicO group peptidase (beta-lactamase class C family)